MKYWNKIKSRSYVPYSGNPEICAVTGESGKMYPGVRIENASFPLSITAVQAAVFGCLSEGDKPAEILLPPGSNPEGLKSFNIPIRHVSDPDLPEAEILIKKQPANNLLDQLKNKAIVPNSGFQVSAIIELPESFISGTNIEINDWTTGLCAERVALSKAISFGYTGFISMHVKAFRGSFISPCGACRQVLIEHIPDKPIRLFHPDGTGSVHICSHLLPHYFSGSSILKK